MDYERWTRVLERELRSLVATCDESELADGSSIDTRRQHAVLTSLQSELDQERMPAMIRAAQAAYDAGLFRRMDAREASQIGFTLESPDAECEGWSSGDLCAIFVEEEQALEVCNSGTCDVAYRAVGGGWRNSRLESKDD